MPEKPKYGEVGAHYRDDRSKVKFIKEVSQTDIDTLVSIFWYTKLVGWDNG